MGAAALPIIVMSVLWGAVALVAPIFVNITDKPNKGVITTVCLITGISCWLFWVLCYLHQMNPLIGPSLHNTTILAIMDIWDGTYQMETPMSTIGTTEMPTTLAA